MTRNVDSYKIQQIALGDHDAFHWIFLKYHPRVKLFINQIIKSESIAEELSQDIFLKVWTSREELPNLRSFDAYLFRMSKNTALNYLSHKYVEDSYSTNNQSSAASFSPEEEYYAKELELLIQLTIDRMPDQRRKIYLMSRDENMETVQIAQTLGLTKKTVHNQISLALKDIRGVILMIFLFFCV
ncbi:MAG: RNA polymerase sigma-70 factor [Mangrovibacterium sp.]